MKEGRKEIEKGKGGIKQGNNKGWMDGRKQRRKEEMNEVLVVMDK